MHHARADMPPRAARLTLTMARRRLFAGLNGELTELLGADVDVVPATALKPAIRGEILAEAIAV